MLNFYFSSNQKIYLLPIINPIQQTARLNQKPNKPFRKAYLIEKCYKENANYKWVIGLELSIRTGKK